MFVAKRPSGGNQANSDMLIAVHFPRGSLAAFPICPITLKYSEAESAEQEPKGVEQQLQLQTVNDSKHRRCIPKLTGQHSMKKNCLNRLDFLFLTKPDHAGFFGAAKERPFC